ncbi:MAG: YfhO family protein [Lachnospiraceae bacterium]|nr:YfhO family protein [Lachnospiraceae bacterium]
MTAFAFNGVYPFGSNMALTGDALYQFIDFISYLKTIVFGNNDLVYSLSKNLGGEMAGLAAYYYYSPLNLITLLFSKETLPTGLFLIFCLGPGLASFSMFVCIDRLKGASMQDLIFSYAYGLSGFLIVYAELFHYYSSIIMLPLVYLGLMKLIEKRKPDLCYILSLALAVIFNYYFGYMICIFCALIYLYEVLLDREKIKAFIAFAVSSVTAGALSAFVLIPAVRSLSGEKSNLSIGFFFLFNPLDLFSKFYTGSFKGDFGTGLPNIYCGLLVFLFLLLFFFNEGISKKEKLVTGGLLFFFWMNFCINTLNVVWHGFNQPIGYPQRFAYIVVFFIIIKAREACVSLGEKQNRKVFIMMAAVFAGYDIYLLLSHNKNTWTFDIILSTLFFFIFALLLYKRPKGLVPVLILLTVADLFANAYITFDNFNLSEYEEYSIPVERTKELTDFVKERDRGLYRIEKTFRRTHNDPLMNDYAGLSHYSSSEKMSTIRFMGRLGFRDNGNWAYYGEGNTALTDSILGVKYLLSQFDVTGKPYEKMNETDEGYSTFKNPYALPLLYASKFDDDIKDFESIRDPFKLQEEIADGITGTSNDIFSPIPVKKTYEDNKRAVYEITVNKDGMVEAYFDAPHEQKVRMYHNGGDFGDYFSTYRWNVLDLGRQEKGTVIEIAFESESGEDIKVDGAYFYIEDYDALKTFYEDVVSEKCEITKITSSHYKGSVHIDDSAGVIFSVPYDENWKASVDGNDAEIIKTGGDLLGVKVPEGDHEVDLRYVSPGQKEGNMISVLAVVFLILYMPAADMIRKRRAGRRN